MTRTEYWLPCRCGRKVVIEPRQAGQRVACGCGRELDVPQLRKILRLERAIRSSNTGARAWGGGQRLLFSGGLLLFLATIAAAWLAWSWPARPPSLSELMEKETLALNPLRSLELWEMLRAGRHPQPLGADSESYHQRWLKACIALGVVLGAVAIGASLLLVGWAYRRRKPPPADQHATTRHKPA